MSKSEKYERSADVGAWDALELTWIECPLPVQDEYADKVNDINENLSRNFTFSHGIDWTLTHANAKRNMLMYLRNDVKILLKGIMASLYKGGYLEQQREFEEGQLT